MPARGLVLDRPRPAAPPAIALARTGPASGPCRRLVLVGLASLIHGAPQWLAAFVAVRMLAPDLFGAFSLTLASLMAAGMVQGALVLTPLGVHWPRTADPSGLVAACRAADRLLALAAGAVTGLVLAAAATPGAAAAIGGLMVATHLGRTFSRTAAIARLAPVEALRGDGLRAIVAAAGLGVLFATGVMGVPAFVAIGLVLVAANLVPVLAQRRAPRIGLARSLSLYAHRYLPDARWSLAGVAAAFLMQNAHVVVLSARGDLATLATVTAPGLLVAPLRLLIAPLLQGLRSEFAHALARRDTTALVHAARLALFGVLGTAALLATLMLVDGPGLLSWLVPAGYDRRALELGAWLWLGWATCAGLRTVTTAALIALGRFRSMGAINAAGAALALTLAAGLVAAGLSGGIVAAILAAEAFALVAEGAVAAGAFAALFGRGRAP